MESVGVEWFFMEKSPVEQYFSSMKLGNITLDIAGS